MQEDYQEGRAWIEINLDNLEYNVEQIKKQISDKTKIMAVVKANAYGHGDILIAKKLNEIGIHDFAVATLEEGIHLRKNNIQGNILILGYTSPKAIKKIIENDLTQALVDEEYSKQIQKENHTKIPLKVHIKINTGMNRIGFSSKDITALEKVFQIPEIQVTGMFSHLAVADDENEEAKKFTKQQMQELQDCVDALKQTGNDVGKIHIQSSYGIFAENHNSYDYIRTGIFLYGITEKKDFYLKPVLSLKAKVESIHMIQKGETVGYGRSYTAQKEEKIAAVSIGYADGYPRGLSNQGTKVLIHGKYAEIVGKICMDQLMINVSNLKDVKVGDIVTFIGKDSDKEIHVNELAKKAGTISYEILARLGQRLPRIAK